MFRINKLTDYAVVLLVDMARTQRVRAAHDIAAETGVPVPTVAKVMKALVRGGLVRSTRGASGGYVLARPADRIVMADMIEALEGPIAMTACVDHADDGCEREGFCPMAGHWNRVNHAVRRALVGITLADVAGSCHPPVWANRASQGSGTSTGPRDSGGAVYLASE
ncbi:SUF system Fe-S cluster assembly regulator [Roseospira marina]|uniref:SUF system Fe-S cluster assembly regulator n=1 Tax=Roseospira marina TaxID=140057 RepID=A0A5M6IH43_9PROT|nr:SUF system Fe-S cluster assembly regulator [Roseospira marina]KAA5607079.1 SUF system Fe-S cluster assembly regulator [Roseospira marina]MBB4312729.1 FeS assembly SUF system regulator [Roseospira marina]MBB5086498.1 FeS assembly SUF system regulator [Roseospira marina]